MGMLKFHVPADICYGSISFFLSILHNIFLLYHVDMFVSVYKIDKTSFWIGEGIFLLWNSMNDPLFGWFSDKRYLASSGTKGHSASDVIRRRLTAIQWNGPLMALTFLAFWVGWLWPGLQFVVCLCVYDGFLTMLDLHHSSLLADLAVSAEVRTRLNSRCSMFGILGSASVFISYTVWNKDALGSFRIFCLGLSALSFVGFITVAQLLKQQLQRNPEFHHTKQDEWHHSRKSAEDESDTVAMKKFIRQLISHKNFLWFAVMNLIQVFHCHFNSNFFPLFLENLLGNAVTPGLSSFLIGISFVAPHINNLYFLVLCRKLGTYAVIRLLFLIKLSLSVVMLLVGPTNLPLLCIFIASNRVFTEGTCKLLNLVISDLVDEDFVIHRRSQAVSALMFGSAALLSKPGQTFAPLIGTYILALQTGHDVFESGTALGSMQLDLHSGSESLHAQQRQGFFDMLVYVPIACAVLQLLVWSKFNLHGRRLRRIKQIREGSEHVPV